MEGFKLENQYCSVKELARHLGISEPKAYELVKRQDFPSIKVSEKRWLVIKNRVDSWALAESEKVKV